MPALLLKSLLFALAGFWVLLPHTSQAQTAVDLELVLAVDVSLSMDMDEQRLQRDGYVQALRDPEVQKAIASGPSGRYLHGMGGPPNPVGRHPLDHHRQPCRR
jgi:hypothetical protein